MVRLSPASVVSLPSTFKAVTPLSSATVKLVVVGGRCIIGRRDRDRHGGGIVAARRAVVDRVSEGLGAEEVSGGLIVDRCSPDDRERATLRTSADRRDGQALARFGRIVAQHVQGGHATVFGDGEAGHRWPSVHH